MTTDVHPWRFRRSSLRTGDFQAHYLQCLGTSYARGLLPITSEVAKGFEHANSLRCHHNEKPLYAYA
jgi:hypothetical protein